MKRLLLDLVSYGGTDPLAMFPLFLKRITEVLAPRLAVVFWRLFRLGSSPVCWRVANVTPIPKGPPSSSASNYRPISLTPILSKVFEHLVSVRLGCFVECRGLLPTTKFACMKCISTCDALLCVAYTLQSALEIRQEARMVRIDFCADFDRVNHQVILFMLCSVGVGGSVLSVLTQFLSNRSQYVVVDGCRSKLVNVVSAMPQGSVLGPLWFLLYTAELFSVVENKIYGYADDSTLVAVVPSPGERVAVSESMNRDLNKVSVCCNLSEIKLTASKTKTMIVSMSFTVHSQLTPLTLGGTVLKESADLVILGGITFDAKMTFEKHLRSVSSAAAQTLGIMRKSWQVFHDRSLFLRPF